MQRVKTATAIADKPPYTETGTPGYFRSGDPVAATSPTVPGQDWFNMVQEELLNVIKASGLTPSATDDTQLKKAVLALIAANAVTVSPASETVAGILKLATAAQALAGADTATAMTPADVAAAALSGTGRVALAAGTADALTATVPTPQTALVNGMSVLVRAAAANTTTTPTLNLTLGATATGAKGIVGPAGAALAVGAIAGAGHWLALTYDATLDKWMLGNPTVTASASIIGAARNLTMSATGLSALVSMTADELVLKSAGVAKLCSGLALSASTAAAGAGGLDTGAIAASTWYAVFIIAKEDGTTALLLSLSATAPTMPLGYTYKARIGWIRTDGTANKYPLGFVQVGKLVHYRVAAGSNLAAMRQMISGAQGEVTTPTWIAVPVNNFVPATAIKIAVALINGGNGYAVAAQNNSYGPMSSTTNPPPVTVNATTTNVVNKDFILESTNLYYAANLAGGGLFCVGWEDC
ncbi:hypothetical protein [Humidesulfovibrio idahonensis]